MSAFGGPPRRAPNGRPRWLVPAIAAAVAVVAAAGVIFFATRGSSADDTGSPSSPIEVTDSSSPANAGTSTSTSPPVQYCDGTTIAVGRTCSTTEPSQPSTCWDESPVASGLTCPAVTGQAGLEWVFPVPDAWTRTCEPFTDRTQYELGEEEVIKCTIDELPEAVFFLSRWTGAAAGRAALTSRYGAPVDWSLAEVKSPVGVGWTTDQVSSDGTGRTGVRVDLYNDHPFSVLGLFVDPTGAGKETEARWDSGQLFVDTATIAARSGS